MSKFSLIQSAEKKLAIQLRKVGKIVGGIIETHSSEVGIIRDENELNRALVSYSEALGPWADAVTKKIISSIANSNRKAWNSKATKLSADLRKTLNNTSIGDVALQLQKEQVNLIKSLPIEAGIKAQAISQEAMLGGVRAEESSKKIKNLGNITSNRGVLIARTETAKANAVMTQARAHSIGVENYIWRTMQDADVRETHRKVNGKVFSFANPPLIEGEGYHGPGEIWNCRCFAEPIIPG